MLWCLRSITICVFCRLTPQLTHPLVLSYLLISMTSARLDASTKLACFHILSCLPCNITCNSYSMNEISLLLRDDLDNPEGIYRRRCLWPRSSCAATLCSRFGCYAVHHSFLTLLSWFHTLMPEIGLLVDVKNIETVIWFRCQTVV